MEGKPIYFVKKKEQVAGATYKHNKWFYDVVHRESGVVIDTIWTTKYILENGGHPFTDYLKNYMSKEINKNEEKIRHALGNQNLIECQKTETEQN